MCIPRNIFHEHNTEVTWVLQYGLKIHGSKYALSQIARGTPHEHTYLLQSQLNEGGMCLLPEKVRPTTVVHNFFLFHFTIITCFPQWNNTLTPAQAEWACLMLTGPTWDSCTTGRPLISPLLSAGTDVTCKCFSAGWDLWEQLRFHHYSGTSLCDNVWNSLKTLTNKNLEDRIAISRL